MDAIGLLVNNIAVFWIFVLVRYLGVWARSSVRQSTGLLTCAALLLRVETRWPRVQIPSSPSYYNIAEGFR